MITEQLHDPYATHCEVLWLTCGLGCLWGISGIWWTFDIIIRFYMKNYDFIPMDLLT